MSDIVSGAPPSPVIPRDRIKPGRRSSLRDCLKLQRLTLATAETLAADVQLVEDKERRGRIAQALAQVVRSWETLEDRKRIMRGLPLPGSKRPAMESKRKGKTATMLSFAPAEENVG